MFKNDPLAKKPSPNLDARVVMDGRFDETTAHAHRQRQLSNLRHKARGRRPCSGQPRADLGAGGEKEGADGALRIETENTQVRITAGPKTQARQQQDKAH